MVCVFFFFKQKTAYEIVDCDWSSDVCSSDLADIQVGQRTGLTVPATALLPQPDGSVRVYVLDADQTAVARSIEIGARVAGVGDAPDQVEILQGLDAGEQVIVAGAGYVQDGDTVTVAE